MNRKYTLKKNWEFKKIIENKLNQIITKKLIVYFIPNNKSHLRLGISVSKKLGNSPTRNYLRRQIRSIFVQLKIWSLKKDIVLIVRKPFINLPFLDKKNSIINTIKKIKNVQ